MKISFEVYDVERGDFRNFQVIDEFPENAELKYIDNINCYIRYINQYDINGYTASSDYIIYADTKTIKYVGECADLVEEYVTKNIQSLREEKFKRIINGQESK